MDLEMNKDICELVINTPIAFVSSVNQDGFPNTKAMLNLKRDDIKTHYFSTNLSSKRASQFQANPNACIYFCEQANFKGLLLVGSMEVMTDRPTREMLWVDGFEMYYPKGIDDDDYVVLKFTAQWGNYYHGLQNSTFTIEELLEAIIL